MADEERKVLWPECKDEDPDILLSIGTAFHSGTDKPLETDSTSNFPGPAQKKSNIKKGAIGFLKRFFNLAKNMLQRDLDCEIPWEAFINARKEDGKEFDLDRKRKFTRLNIDLKDYMENRPKLDDVSLLDKLKDVATKVCQQQDNTKLAIKAVAATLIASLFYFKVAEINIQEEEVHGMHYPGY